MRYRKIIAEFKTLDKVSFPQNPVNTFRGAVGYFLKKIVCFQRSRKETGCRGCPGERHCLYSVCFEPGARGDAFSRVLGGGADIPHPLVFDADFSGPLSFEAEKTFRFGITLFGPAAEALAHIVCALREAGEYGFTKSRIPCPLIRVRQDGENGPVLYSEREQILRSSEVSHLVIEEPRFSNEEETRLTVDFLSPTSFKNNEDGNVINVPEFHRIVRSVVRRYSVFQVADERPALQWNFRELFSRAEKVGIVGRNLQAVRWERFSTKQRQRAFWGGCIGKAVFEGDLRPFLSLLRAGEILHVGRGTTFGQGRYVVEPADSPVRMEGK